MNTNTLPNSAIPLGAVSPSLGEYLRDRRSRLQPEPGAPGRRRTPGLRREEVAMRAGVSVTWYTWLEQGRGGPPSDEVLERLARALELDRTAREMLFLLAQQRPPPVVPAPLAPVTPILQHILDALPSSPAFIKTPTWDIVAWNEAMRVVLGNFADPATFERNLLRRFFKDPAVRAQPDWEAIASFAVGVFKVDVARAGAGDAAAGLIAELQAASADFRRMWAESDVRRHGIGLKHIRHPVAGLLELEYAAFSIDGADGLTMIVYTPATAETARAVEALMAQRDCAA